MVDYLQQPHEQRFRDLRLIFCGREDCRPLHRWGPGVRPDYIIHYVTKGKGIYRVGQETWEVHENEGFLIRPEVQVFYQADKDAPWSYSWIGFGGDLAPAFVKELGLGDDRFTFFCSRKAELEQIVSNMLLYQRYSVANDLMLQSQLYLFFACLMKDMLVYSHTSLPRKNNYVQGAIAFIKNNYTNPIKVTDVAAYVGIDRTYLYTLFREETGMSPGDYLRNFRLTRAAELLSLSRYPVESIAYSCGYQDALVFSKAFKQKYGITPTQYRKKN